jgi:transcriptional regulator with XRE-family HTH domain
MSQQELLALLGVTQKYMSNLENGKFKRLDGSILVSLAKHLETTTDFILSGKGDPKEDHDDEVTLRPAETVLVCP